MLGIMIQVQLLHEGGFGLNSEKINLGDLCEAIIDCEHKTAPVEDEGIPSIRTTDI